MVSLTDITGFQLNLEHPPRRIVSLVPSTTYSVCALGKQETIVGITNFCHRPSSLFAQAPKIGGTKTVSIQDVYALSPDIVLANKEENTKEDIEALRARGITVFVAFPQTLEQALSDLVDLGKILDAEPKANALVDQIQTMRTKYEPFQYVYLIWKNPAMSISSNTFISSMLKEIGGTTPYTTQDRYPTIEHIPPDIDALLLSSEPFPFKEKHKKELSERFRFPENKIHLIDGAHCSWHGANMLHALPYLHAWRERL